MRHDHRAKRTEATVGEDETFVRRWSRRKHASAEDADAAADAGALAPGADGAAAASPGADVPEDAGSAPTDADVPPVESLHRESDYSGFLSPKVSESLRRAALRKLFSMPEFNVRDGLDDYDDDYTSFTALGNTITADMRHRAEREAAGRPREEAEQVATAQSADEGSSSAPESRDDTRATESEREDPDAGNDVPDAPAQFTRDEDERDDDH